MRNWGASAGLSAFTVDFYVFDRMCKTSLPISLPRYHADAFYAQVEMRRLDLDPTKPCCVQQWFNLIAVNYPARSAGVTRHISAVNARRLCPDINLVHVETLDEAGRVIKTSMVGSSTYNQSNTKVSLARYRSASQAIFALLVRLCGAYGGMHAS